MEKEKTQTNKFKNLMKTKSTKMEKTLNKNKTTFFILVLVLIVLLFLLMEFTFHKRVNKKVKSYKYEKKKFYTYD